jgi:hypothetical protein
MQENVGGRASEQDDDVVVDLIGAWWCRVALVVGEVDHASGSFSEVGGCSGTYRGRNVEAG